MGLLNKLGIAIGSTALRENAKSLPDGRNGSHRHNGSPATGAHREPAVAETTRVSNGLKDFLWNLDGLGHGTLLDLGPAWQTTLSFFIERGFRVTSDDLLRSWGNFLTEQENLLKAQPQVAEDFASRTPEALAKKFIAENVEYPANSFDALLLWDVLDYLEPTLAKHVVATLTEMLRPGGVVFAMFHSKKPEVFHRYRVMGTNTLQVLGSKCIVPAQKVYQNREIQDLFGRYRTVKSYVGRDQLRESLFIK
jgi:hypothetical protein